MQKSPQEILQTIESMTLQLLNEQSHLIGFDNELKTHYFEILHIDAYVALLKMCQALKLCNAVWQIKEKV